MSMNTYKNPCNKCLVRSTCKDSYYYQTSHLLKSIRLIKENRYPYPISEENYLEFSTLRHLIEKSYNNLPIKNMECGWGALISLSEEKIIRTEFFKGKEI